MRRIYSDYAYGRGPRDGCWWDETISAPQWPELNADISVDVAIVGGGFTGVSAALTLAEAGVSVAVLEAQSPGWGASGRNGGFCCLGGGRLSDGELQDKYGGEGRQQYYDTERAAIYLVAGRLERFGIDADRHSDGETQLAHSPRAMEGLRRSADALVARYGVETRLTEKADLASEGLNAGFHGALTIRVGFALNPRKYLFGIARAAEAAGAALYQRTPVTRIDTAREGVRLFTPGGQVRCERAIIATNGYSSEDMPDWLAGRYMPSQSNVLVTRPLTEAELNAQGWTSLQASYDSRNLLHYFHLMPDRRFLFGARGGLRSSPAAEARARRSTRRDFEKMFPAWADVETPHQWSGMVCLARDRAPFVGPVPGQPGLYASLCYHGNGVAKGSWSGTQLARVLLNPAAEQEIPRPMRRPLTRFPLGPVRRMLMPPVYFALRLADLR